MTIHRRDFLRAGATASALTLTPSWLRAIGTTTAATSQVPPITDPTVRELALRAVEAARAAGASYADVRLTHTREATGDAQSEQAWRDSGVRALVNGYWGFAASTHWTPDELARLGRAAVHQAQVHALGKTRVVELGAMPVVPDGHWVQPVARDPFDVAEGEIRDFWASLDTYLTRKSRAKRLPQKGMGFNCRFRRQDKAFASSEGSYCTQRLYRTTGLLRVQGVDQRGQLWHSTPVIAGASRGWEYLQQAPLREEIDRLVEEILADLALPVKPVEVGRYDIVVDAQSMAELLAETLGCATDLARALGYLAHEIGTSYLNDPLTMLGSYQAGAPLLTVLAERTAPGGLATVKWDDEGVEPDQFALVKDGVLVDFLTHREGAGWLQQVYAKQGRPVRSHGCAAAERAFESPAIAMPNLTLAPGREALGFDDLVGGVKRGLAVKNLNLTMDWQCLNGFGVVNAGMGGRVYEVKDGQRVARIEGAEFLVRAPELWKALQALGGERSQASYAVIRQGGQPPQTVTAVPGVVTQVTTIKAAGN